MLGTLFLGRSLPGPLATAAILAWTGLSGPAVAQPLAKTFHQQVEGMTKIRITVEGTEITAILDDNATSRDFISLLPMTLTLEDYSEIEKVSDLSKRLSTEGAPEGTDPSVGDITYYAPWGNLALFYRDFGYARGLVHMGRVESGIEFFKQPGPISVTIERTE